MKTLLSSILALALASSAVAASPYIGASVGYLIDGEEELISARLGFVVAESAQVNHGLELEVGYSGASESGVDLDVIPVFANYRGTLNTSEKISLQFGGGVGFSRVKASGFGVNFSDTPFSAQAFAGVGFRTTERSSIDLGARYIWFDDVSIAGVNLGSSDDVAVELGFSIRF